MEKNNMLQEAKKHFSKIGVRYFIGVLLIYMAQLVVYGVCTTIWPQIKESYNLSTLSLMAPLYIIGMPLMIYFIRQIPAETASEKKKMKISHWFVAFLMCYAGMNLANFAGQAVTSVISIFKQDTVDNVMGTFVSELHPGLTFLFTIICAPIFEEIIYRKLLVDRTVKCGEGTAVVLSGLMFGLFHGNLNQFIYTFFLGSFFAFIYVKTRNLLHVILLHMAVNFMAGFALNLVCDCSGYYELVQAAANGATEAELTALSMEHMAGMLVLGIFGMAMIGMIIAGVVLFIVNRKKFVLTQQEVVLPKGKRFTTIFLNLGMILFCGFWIIQMIVQLLA